MTLPCEERAECDGVRLAAGSVADVASWIEAITKDQRVWALLYIIGQTSKGTVDHDDLGKL